MTNHWAAASDDRETLMTEPTPQTFVLVHGAWHGGWCWRRVADQLQRAGHKVYTPTLTGLADRSHLMMYWFGVNETARVER